MLIDRSKLGFGTMELCITPDRPSLADARRLLTDLVEDHGVQFIDTADAYSLGEDDFGYGEELTKHLMNRKDVLVGTKGGFTRPGGAWVKRGDPKYIREACEKSLQRLNVDSIPLYQFHQPDPNVPFEETLGAFIELKNEGKVQNLGLSNVTFEQLEIAANLTKIATVQNGFSLLWYAPPTHDPMLRFCEAHDITYLAYAPLGGHKNPGAITQPEELQAFATRTGVTMYQFALMFLKSLSPNIVPIPGSKNREHILHNLEATKAPIPADVLEELMTICAE